jgi:hypothetical protein
MAGQLGLAIQDTQTQHRSHMNIEEKRNIILQRISQLDERIQILQSNVDGGYQNKEGLPSFESLIQDSIRAKNALIAAIDDL